MGEETALGKQTSSPACSSEIQIFIKPPYIHFLQHMKLFSDILYQKNPLVLKQRAKKVVSDSPG